MILKTYIDTTQHQVFEYSNISGKVENYNGSNVVPLTKDQNHQLFLLGKDKDKYKKVFKVKNNFCGTRINRSNGRLSTVGGVTKSNNKTSETKTQLVVNKVDGGNLDASIDSF